MTRKQREENVGAEREFLVDTLCKVVPDKGERGALIALIDQYVRHAEAATVALCAEGMNCAFCKGWLQGHDAHETDR